MGHNIHFGTPSSRLTLVHICEYSFLTDYILALILKNAAEEESFEKGNYVECYSCQLSGGGTIRNREGQVIISQLKSSNVPGIYKKKKNEIRKETKQIFFGCYISKQQEGIQLTCHYKLPQTFQIKCFTRITHGCLQPHVVIQ